MSDNVTQNVSGNVSGRWVSAEELAEYRREAFSGIDFDPGRDQVIRDLILHIDAQQAEIDRLEREYADLWAKHMEPLVDTAWEQRDRLAGQVAALREALEVSEAQFSAESANVFGHARLQVDMNRLVVTEQVRRALADTEAAAREHDQRLRLEGAREFVRRWDTRIGTVTHADLLDDMEAENEPTE